MKRELVLGHSNDKKLHNDNEEKFKAVIIYLTNASTTWKVYPQIGLKHCYKDDNPRKSLGYGMIAMSVSTASGQTG